MTGKKGMKWDTDRKPQKVQVAGRVDKTIEDKLRGLAEKNRWTVSSTVAYILEEYFNEQGDY